MRREYSISSTLHLAFGEVGHEWVIEDRFTVRLGMGFAKAFAASTSVDADFTDLGPQFAVFGNAAAAYLDDLYTSYVYVPTLSFGAGYRFR
jgi:hypothetical protein